ncbi:DUF1682-domain-containing protein [Pisolithus marmoratus]|nr:DUF1682-domain-containing protein [Pisolithus marmoratus]
MASLLVPPPYSLPEHYDGWQLSWKFLVFRPAILRVQACLLLALLVYVALSLYGKAINARKADQFYSAVLPLLSQHFSKPTSSLISDGPSDFFIFSTGRRAISSLHTVLALRPRHDLLQIIWQYLWSAYDLRYEPFDALTFDLTLDNDAAAAAPDFIWAVVRKSELTAIRDQRWDLTFTRTANHPGLDSTLSVMSELADVTETLAKLVPPSSSTPLLTLISSALPYLRVFSITDQPVERPTASAPPTRLKRAILTFNLPDSTQGVHHILPLLEGTFALVDLLATGKVTFRPETRAKIKKVREGVEKAIKEDEEKEKREEILEDRRSAKRKAEQERIAKAQCCGPEEGALERERKRALKKSQGKLVRKV